MAQTTTDLPPSQDDWEAIRSAIEAASKALQLKNDTAETIREKIQAMADGVARGTIDNPLGEDVAVALGALWGNQLCDAYAWEWIVAVHGDWRGLGVADRERRYLALPFNLFSRIIDEKDDQTPGPHVRWNAIGANHLPESSPGKYTIITG